MTHWGYISWIAVMPLTGVLMACHPSLTTASEIHALDDDPCTRLSQMGMVDPIAHARTSFRTEGGGRFLAVFSQLGPLFFGINDFSDPEISDQELVILEDKEVIWVPESDYFCEGSDAAVESFERYNQELMRLHIE